MRVASELAAIIVSQIVSQTDAVQRAFKTVEDDIANYATEFAADLVQIATGHVSQRLVRFKASLPDPEATLLLADDWAGPVAGPTEIERFYGIPRSTLYRWHKHNEAVAINTRTGSKPVFPLRQFIDGRPLPGLATIISILGSQRDAWKWLISPNPDFTGDAPLNLLVLGKVDMVADAAGLWARNRISHGLVLVKT
ncbi:antitoxin Xre/MbcA/ParS-like domain-containing protein [Mesorhizobium sp. 14Argb]